MAARGVREPPEVDPVCVDLVVAHQDHALREACFEASAVVFCFGELASAACVPAYSYYGWGEPVCELDEDDCEALFG